MGYPYTMTYTPATGQIILPEHITTSNQEHINNNIPESIDDYSVNATEMGSTADPYPASSESLATTLDGELQRLRYQLDSIIKKFNVSATKWYHDVTDAGVLWKKGADVASAAALPLLNDGIKNTVTGTTAITSMNTVGIGTVKVLVFSGSLTLTSHATAIVLPGDQDIVTQAGDIAIFHEYGTGLWELVSYQKDIALKSWSHIETLAASNDATVNFVSGIGSLYNTYMVIFENIVPVTDATHLYFRCGAGSIDSGASDYGWGVYGSSGAPAQGGTGDNTDAQIQITQGTMGTGTGESLSGRLYIHAPNNGSYFTHVEGQIVHRNSNANFQVSIFAGSRVAAQADDRIQFLASSGNISSGNFRLYGLEI